MHSHIKHKRVDPWSIQFLWVVIFAKWITNQDVQKVGRRLSSEVVIEFTLEQHQRSNDVGEDKRTLCNLWELVDLEVAIDGIMERNALGCSRENNVPQLNAALRDHVAEGEVVRREECREVMYKHQDDTKGAIVVLLHGIGELQLA